MSKEFDPIQNLKHFDSITGKEAAKKKKGMQYWSSKVKEDFVKNPDLRRALKGAQKRYSSLMKKSNENGLTATEVKEFNAITSFINKFLDKTFASQIESKNENFNNDNIVINTIKPDPDE